MHFREKHYNTAKERRMCIEMYNWDIDECEAGSLKDKRCWKYYRKNQYKKRDKIMPNKKYIIYIASPYTIGDNFVNVQRQIETANELLDNGFIPFSPLLQSVYLNAQKERDYHLWLDNDYAFIERFDGLLRLEGESKGADGEVSKAHNIKIPVFKTIEEIKNYFKK
jgi:hypothetical protein